MSGPLQARLTDIGGNSCFVNLSGFVENIVKEKRGSSRLGIRVISRAVAVMDALREHPSGLSLGEIAKLVDLPRSTVQRIVNALDEEGMVMAASATEGIKLGPRLTLLAAAAKFDIVDFCRPALVKLAKDTGETVDLSVWNHDKVVFVDHLPGTHRLRAVSAIGISFPLHCCAPGKAMLAALPDEELDRFRKRLKLEKMTKSTIVTWHRLNRELDTIRKTGIAFDREEYSQGISAIGVALSGPTELAAVSIPVPTVRFDPKERQLAALLANTCEQLQKRIQYKREFAVS
jgi:DNA-binding IclR family transcriptional regulator